MTHEEHDNDMAAQDAGASATEATDFIAEAITEWFGERCPDYAEGCAACDAWKQYDDLRALSTEPGEAVRDRIAEILMTHPLVDAPKDMAENFQALADSIVAILPITALTATVQPVPEGVVWQYRYDDYNTGQPVDWRDGEGIPFSVLPGYEKRKIEAAAQADFEARIRSCIVPAPLSNPEAPAARVASETERLVRASQWLQKRWFQKYPNVQHIKQLAEYEAYLSAALVATPPAPTSAVDGEMAKALREAIDPDRDSLTIMDRLRLYVEDPSTFEFSVHDAGEVLDAFEAALKAQASPATLAVPGEMVLVPREPNAKMRVAGIDAAYAEEKLGAPLRDSIPAAYRAMILAGEGYLPEDREGKT